MKKKSTQSRLKGTDVRFHGEPEAGGFLMERKEQIIEGALRAFLAQGYAVSMDAVAQEAGVAKQTLYSYFKDKRSLFAALMDRLFQAFVTAGITPELLQLETPALLRKLAQVILSRMDDWEYVSLLRLVIAESARFPELADLYITQVVRPATETLAGYIKQSKDLPFADPEATARIIHGSLIHFILVQEVLQGKHTVPLARERLVNALVDLVLFAAETARDSR